MVASYEEDRKEGREEVREGGQGKGGREEGSRVRETEKEGKKREGRVRKEKESAI